MFTYHPCLTAHSIQPPFTSSLKLHFHAETSRMNSVLRVRPSGFLLTYMVSSGCDLFSDRALLLWQCVKAYGWIPYSNCCILWTEASLSPKVVTRRLLRTWETGGTDLPHNGSLCTYMQIYHVKLSWAASTLVCYLAPWYIQQSKYIH